MTTYTNLLTKLNVSAIDPGQILFPLSSYIPGGTLDVTHLQVRYRPVGGYWLAWGPVDAWNAGTKVVTFDRPLITIEQLEFRRTTPKYALWRDPQARTSRVSNTNFKANADQGLFVATELAAIYGIDALQLLLAEPGDGPNELGLVQQTQNHWGPDADFTKTTWNFQFAGGYIDRAHVKAQALLPAGWTSLTIDPSENDPGAPSNAPFRFIGDYQLRLDLSTLAGPVTGLIIYRQTPRNVNVSVPADAARIRATGMEPSARHALFVAVELGEELAKRAPPCECQQFYTSLIYPYLSNEDTLAHVLPTLVSGSLWGVPDDSMSHGLGTLQSGTLNSVLTFVSYTNQRDVNPDSLANAIPTLRSGTLVANVTLVVYTNQRDVNPDSLAHAIPPLQSGTLAVTISYLSYINQRDVAPDSLAHALPTLQSGTLV